jgi:hypothetical protein
MCKCAYLSMRVRKMMVAKPYFFHSKNFSVGRTLSCDPSLGREHMQAPAFLDTSQLHHSPCWLLHCSRATQTHAMSQTFPEWLRLHKNLMELASWMAWGKWTFTVELSLTVSLEVVCSICVWRNGTAWEKLDMRLTLQLLSGSWVQDKEEDSAVQCNEIVVD